MQAYRALKTVHFRTKRKNITFLAVTITATTIVMAFIDATMTVWQIDPVDKIPPVGLLRWWAMVPWWWIVIPAILSLLTAVCLVAFLIGGGKLHSLDWAGLVMMALIPLVFIISGMFDLISATVCEYLKGNHPLNWVSINEWWWTVYHPFPRLAAALAGRVYPTWIDMLVGSVGGATLIVALWFCCCLRIRRR